MVLSLGFILAFIGAAVALLIGILIFSQVSDSIICPAGGTTTPPVAADITFFTGTGSSATQANYFEADVSSNFTQTTGILNEAVVQNGTSSLDTQGEIRIGSASDGQFLHDAGTGSSLVSIAFWIKGDVDGSAEYPLISTVDLSPNTGDGFLLYTDGGGPVTKSYFRTNSISEFHHFNVTTGIPADDGQWHLMTYTWSKAITDPNPNQRLCIDGSGGCEQINQNGVWGASAAPPDPITIGDDDHNTGGGVVENTFEVDEIIMWNGYILTNTDIDNMYNSGSGSSGAGISSGNIVIYHSFDDAQANFVGGSAGSSTSGQGSDECENAKDTAWTVIGILPVALFFALFAIFGALGRTS